MQQNTLSLEAFDTQGDFSFRKLAKRLLDIHVAIIALIMLSPLFIIIGVLVKLSDGGPVFYSHKRIGFFGSTFGCLKFRSMRTDAAARLEDVLKTDPTAREEWEKSRKLKIDPRVTFVGNILRRSSIDELPQLFNVLRGEMSLVGPRPITADELPRYGEHVSAYLSSRPGLTGHWQISGRSDLSYDNRVSLDLYYITNWSFWLDVTILAKTIPALLSQKGSY